MDWIKLVQFLVDHPDLVNNLVSLITKLLDAAQGHPALMDAIVARIKGSSS